MTMLKELARLEQALLCKCYSSEYFTVVTTLMFFI